MMSKISAVDLFCGAGGLTHGLINSDINVVAGFDIEASCKYAYENNNDARFYNEDVSKIDSEFLASLYPPGDIKLLAGCAPCQPFSTYSQGKEVQKDKKWPLLYSFARLIKEINPELVTMENVPDVTKHRVYNDFVKDLESLGYNVSAKKIYCPDYGLPQNRKRHVLLASKLGDISFIPPNVLPKDYKTVKDVISHLPVLSAGEKDKNDILHASAGLSDLNLKRIKASKPGGTWRDWPEDLVASCHKKPTGKTYSGVYARMKWEEPSPTITTQCFGYGNGRFGHPEQDRAISLREAAILQSFPNSYQFIEDESKFSMTSIGRMIGNAVPVALGTAIGNSFISHIKQIQELSKGV